MKNRTWFIAAGLIGLLVGSASIAEANDLLSCVNTWGYWLNHSAYQSVEGAHRDPAWGAIGEDTQFFSNYEDPPANTNPLTWFEILRLPPKAGNAYLILAHQYVAARLNISTGADPSLLGTAIADAGALLSYYSTGLSNTFPPTIPKGASYFTADDRARAVGLASLLDRFNKGYLGPGPCVCPCWSDADLSGLTASSCVQSSDNEHVSVATVQNFTLSTSDSAFPECNVLDHNQNIGFALAITYAQFLDCRDGLEGLIAAAGLTCAASPDS